MYLDELTVGRFGTCVSHTYYNVYIGEIQFVLCKTKRQMYYSKLRQQLGRLVTENIVG